MSDNRAAQLHRRVRDLRTLATAIERSPAMSLERHADDNTWRGLRPTLCRNLLHANQTQLHSEVERLRWQAYLFEREAAVLDARAALAAERAS